MTVTELIEKLNTVRDKSLPVHIVAGNSDNDNEDFILQANAQYDIGKVIIGEVHEDESEHWPVELHIGEFMMD